MYTLDYPQNFAITKIDPIAAGGSSVTLEDASKFSDPATSGEYNCVIFNQNTGPADDPTAEIVRVTAKSGSVLTITRAQEGTSDSNHNTSGKIYCIAAVFTAKMITDIDTTLNSKQNQALPKYGTPDFTTLQQYINLGSAGRIDGGILTDDGAGGVNYTAINGTIKATDSVTGEMTLFKIAAGNIPSASLTDNSLNYFYIDNDTTPGTPVVAVTSDRTSVNFNNQFIFGDAWKDGSIIETVSGAATLANFERNENERLAYRGIQHAFGAIIGSTGTRNITSTDGVAYFGNTKITTTSRDTSASDKFTYYYRNGSGGWTKVANQTQIDNLQYDDGDGGLATLSAGRYGVHWVYVCGEGDLYVVYGRGNYTLAQAQAAVIFTLPTYLSSFALLAAKVIVQKSSDTLTITSAYTTLFPQQSAGDHATLANLDYASSGHTGFAPIASPTFTGLLTAPSIAITGSDATGNLLTLTSTDATNYSRIKYVGTVNSFSSGVGNGSATIADLVNKFYIYDFTNTKVAMTIVPNTLAAKFYGAVEAVGAITGSNLSGTNTGDNASNTTSNSYADGKVENSIVDGHTTVAPSGNAVFDALALKSPLASPTFTGTAKFNDGSSDRLEIGGIYTYIRGNTVLPKTLFINDTSADHNYQLAVNELTADRTITLPLLTGNDEFVFKDHIQTLTNKRITKRVASTTDDATAVIDSDSYDEYYLTAIANATEISVTGTPTTGQTIFIGLKDAGVAKGLTWTGITGLGVTLPTTTVAGKQHIIGVKYIASAWRAIAVLVEA